MTDKERINKARRRWKELCGKFHALSAASFGKIAVNAVVQGFWVVHLGFGVTSFKREPRTDTKLHSSSSLEISAPPLKLCPQMSSAIIKRPGVPPLGPRW